MLSRLSIKNVALIEQADLTFGEGLNVLSGETGAGKSVILDSVNFVLGAKADRSMIRFGESECIVKAEFFMPESSKAVQILRDMDIDTDGEILISRKFSVNGKNIIKVNGNTVTAAMLRKVTDCLVDVHGQSEHFFLLSESNQLKVLDEVAGEKLLPYKEELNLLLPEKRSLQEQISMLGGDEQERGRRLDVLRFQIEEIENAELKDGEEEELISKRNKINNLEKIISALREAVSYLSEEGGVLDGVRGAMRSISNISRYDNTYLSLYEKMEEISLDAEDVAATLSDMGDELHFDENEAEEVEIRLDLWRSLKRKYGNNKEEIDAYYSKIKTEYELLSDCEGQYAVLTNSINKINEKIFQTCNRITKIRKETGADFCQRVVKELKTLNIPNAQFAVNFEEYSKQDIERVMHNGLDTICFMFSANAGEPMKSLGKIISGGEMSRFMLAMKTQLSDINEISTYIFDEIDAGISGKTAKVVGEKLAQIANRIQIIAVSHLAQIAVMSDNEFLIEKEERQDKTVTVVHPLDQTGKRKEIVRLLGGTEGDEFAFKHADELLKQAEEYKHSIS